MFDSTTHSEYMKCCLSIGRLYSAVGGFIMRHYVGWGCLACLVLLLNPGLSKAAPTCANQRSVAYDIPNIAPDRVTVMGSEVEIQFHLASQFQVEQ